MARKIKHFTRDFSEGDRVFVIHGEVYLYRHLELIAKLSDNTWQARVLTGPSVGDHLSISEINFIHSRFQ